MRLRDLNYCCADCSREMTAKDIRSSSACPDCGSLNIASYKSGDRRREKLDEDKISTFKRGRRNIRRNKR